MVEQAPVKGKVAGSSPAGGAMKITISWLAVISFLINLILGGVSLYQFVDAKNKEENIKIMQRSWQNHIEGINFGLLNIAQNPKNFTSTIDMAQAVGVAAQSANALNQAISQQRFYSDKEVRQQKETSVQEIKKLMEEYKNKQATNSGQ